ncbi:MAG: ABC transporter permease subunit [Bacteroidales bacterium]|nr:ABC transporter permease subunit [Bacteroidales bacterium]
MKRLIRLEWTKIATYGFFRLVLILTAGLFLLTVFVFSRIDISVPGFTWRNLFRFPDVWQSFAWVASWFNLLLAILVITIAGNEFAGRTLRQQVMTGLSREEWLAGKGILILGLALFGLVTVSLAGLIFGFVYTNELSAGMVFSKMGILPVYLLQAVGYMVLGLLFASLLKSNALAIILYLLYFIMIEPIMRGLLPLEVRPWFPVKIISHLTPMPEILQITSGEELGNSAMTFENIGIMPRQLDPALNLVMALAYILLFGALTYMVVKKRDL